MSPCVLAALSIVEVLVNKFKRKSIVLCLQMNKKMLGWNYASKKIRLTDEQNTSKIPLVDLYRKE